ncbi:MAG: hypothetical protein V3T98_01525 [Candidatus Paceibacterota bacterium]
MKSRRNKKLILAILLVVVVLGLASINFIYTEAAVQTAPSDAGQLAAVSESKPTQQLAQDTVKDTNVIFNIIAGLAATILSLVAGLVDFGIKLGNDVMNLEAVRTGWQIVLNITNLGFVLAIIVIAFATILRLETYAMKQILWKLIIAALLVNFSLVIAGAFISISNIATDFFLQATDTTNLSNALANAMEPQKFAMTIEQNDPEWWQFVERAKNALSMFFSSIASLFFIIVFTFLTILAFATLFIMLLVRFIALAILLILSPIVWLLWIFPATAEHWRKWWQEFIRWNLFAPVVLFFVYLTIITAANMDKLTSVQEASITDAAKGFREATIILEGGFFQHVAELLILVALLFGGIYIANKFSITGGGLGVKWSQTAGKMFGGWVGRKGMQYGTGWLRRKGTEPEAKSLAEKTQGWAAAQKSRLGRFGAGWVARGTTRLSTLGGEDIVKHHEKQVAGISMPDAKAALLTAMGPRKIALINKLKDAKELGDVDMTRIATEDNKKLFARFNRSKAFGGVENSGLMNVEMNEARKRDDKEALLEATASLMAKFTKKDVDPAVFGDVFSGKAKLGLDKTGLKKLSEYIARGTAEKNPALVANIMPKMDSTSRNNFEKIYKDVIRDMPKKIKDDFEKTMANYAVGFSPIEGGAETPKTT